jgi:triphosphatase
MAKIPRARKVSRKVELMPVKAAPVSIVATMSVVDAFVAIVQGAVAHMQANEDGVLVARNPESLHQMRVALRRLRSAFAVFPEIESTVAIAEEMKWLAGRLGDARDWDVFTFETLPRVCESVPEVAGITEIRRQSRRLREAARRRALRALASERYQALKALLYQSTASGNGYATAKRNSGQKPQGDLPRYAEAALQRRYTKVCKRGRSVGKQSWSELHALRIAIKKLRYPVEFFHPLFDNARAHTLRSRLATLQNVLGLMNDGATTEQLVRTRLRADTPGLALAIGMIAGWTEGRTHALRRELVGAWKAFRETKVFW